MRITEYTWPQAQTVWVLLGDDARYEFLTWLLPEEVQISNLRKSPVQVRFDFKFRQEWLDGEYRITTPMILPHMIIYLPPEGCANSLQSEFRSAQYAVFEEHPYKKETTQMILTQLAEYNTAALMVFMDLPLKHSATDISKPGEDLLLATQRCQSQRIPFQTVRDPSGVLPLLHWHEPILDHSRRQMEAKLDQLQERIDGYECDYEFNLEDWRNEHGLLSEEAMYDLSSYRRVLSSPQRSIWGSFSDQALRILFPQNPLDGLNRVAEQYEMCLQDLPFLPIEEDKAFLLKTLRQLAKEKFQQNARPGNKPQPFTETAYLRMMTENNSRCQGIEVTFGKVFSSFVEGEVCPVVKNLLQLRHDQLTKLLK